MPDAILLGEGGGDRVQKLAVIVPCYTNVSTRFLVNFVELVRGIDVDCPLEIMTGPYVAQSMRHAISDLKKDSTWERILVVEQDMILPREAFVKHSLHTDDIVGSVYFQHAPPHHLNIMFRHPTLNRLAHATPKAVKMMLDTPALYKCAVVGLGCTSIARRVVEEWPADLAMFRTDYVHDEADDEASHGEISHDVWLCDHADALGFGVYLDSSIRCDHLTEGWVNEGHFLAIHAAELADAPDTTPHIYVPNREQRRHPVHV